jgi:hypothetical protein
MSYQGSTLLLQWLDYNDNRNPIDADTDLPKYEDPLSTYSKANINRPDLTKYRIGAKASYHTHCLSGWPGETVRNELDIPRGFDILEPITTNFIKENKENFLYASYCNLAGDNHHDIVAAIDLTSEFHSSKSGDPTLGGDQRIAVKLFERGPSKNEAEIYENFDYKNNPERRERSCSIERNDKNTFLRSQWNVKTSLILQDGKNKGRASEVIIPVNMVIVWAGVLEGVGFTDPDGYKSEAVFVGFLNANNKIQPYNAVENQFS